MWSAGKENNSRRRSDVNVWLNTSSCCTLAFEIARSIVARSIAIILASTHQATANSACPYISPASLNRQQFPCYCSRVSFNSIFENCFLPLCFMFRFLIAIPRNLGIREQIFVTYSEDTWESEDFSLGLSVCLSVCLSVFPPVSNAHIPNEFSKIPTRISSQYCYDHSGESGKSA